MSTLNFDFKDKVILVVGGCSGLGKALTLKLSNCDAKVYSTSRDRSKYNTDSELQNKNITLVNLDPNNESEIIQLTQQILKKHKKIDVLVHAAVHRSQSKYLQELTSKDWTESLSTDITGYFLTLKVVAEIMKKQKNGRIVTIGSMYGSNAIDLSIYPKGRRPSPINYATAKAGVIHLTKCIAVEYAKYGVNINCVSSGGVLNNQEKEFLKLYNKKSPIGRMANINEVVDTVLFLASDEASYIVGHNLLVEIIPKFW
jgi:NAD(P)-dependent dehydrogenase (short-subunit alcohol dehydrogenase family)